jgi:hypothetical protein
MSLSAMSRHQFGGKFLFYMIDVVQQTLCLGSILLGRRPQKALYTNTDQFLQLRLGPILPLLDLHLSVRNIA